MKTDLLPRDHYFVLVVTAQIGKLLLILIQPDTHLFLNWFLGFTHHRPYEGYFPLVEGGPATSFVDYSAIWYFFYYPTFYGYHAWFLFSWCIENLFLAVVYRNHGQLYTLYVLQLSFLFSLNSQSRLNFRCFRLTGGEPRMTRRRSGTSSYTPRSRFTPRRIGSGMEPFRSLGSSP